MHVHQQAGIELDDDTVDMALQSPHEWQQVYGSPFPTPTIAPADADSLINSLTAMNTDAAPLQRMGSGAHRPPPPPPPSDADTAQPTRRQSFQPRRRAPVAAPEDPAQCESPPPPRERSAQGECRSDAFRGGSTRAADVCTAR